MERWTAQEEQEFIDHIRTVVQKLKNGGSDEYEINLACWLGERAERLLMILDKYRIPNI